MALSPQPIHLRKEMKQIRNAFMFAAIALTFATSASAGTNQVVNIPYSAAQNVADTGACYTTAPFNGTPGGFYAFDQLCQIELP
jgi:hypothetical protein